MHSLDFTISHLPRRRVSFNTPQAPVTREFVVIQQVDCLEKHVVFQLIVVDTCSSTKINHVDIERMGVFGGD